MDESITESSADAPRAHGHRPWLLALVLVPLALVGVLVVAWAIDTSSGGVPRHVRLAGHEIGGLSEAKLNGKVKEVADAFAGTPVEIVAGEHTYRTTASEVGLMVDADRTTAAALDTGSDGLVLLRPIAWARSFISPREASLVFQVSKEQVATTVTALEGDVRVAPTEPTVELVDGSFHVVPGVDGRGIDPAEVAEDLTRAADRAEVGQPIRVMVEPGPIAPLASDDDARRAASDAEALVSEPVVIKTAGGDRTIEPAQLRTWVELTSQPDGSVDIALDPDQVSADLRKAFADVEGHPKDASFTLSGGVPVILPDEPGKVCCGGDPASLVLAALHDPARTAVLELVDGPATFTVDAARAWGITQAVGGNHAWRNGAPTTAGPGFTTYHAAGGNRVINIHRIADLVRGAVVPPGGSFSVNDYVGKRTTEKGFVPAGAISNGEHVDEVGGGISQFATTTFNAAYFAGLDIDEYQAHSEYFDRYPFGREATMGFPKPDLRFTNNTPYGILIWTSYTSTSLTVTLYSSPYATAEQTGTTETMSGACRSVTTTRTRTFPDGHTEDDKFRARYRPGPGQGC